MISIPMSAEEFAKAKAVVETSDQVISKAETGPNDGTFKTSQVGLSYHFDPTGTLQLTVTEKHGLAKFASDATIQSHLEDLLTTVNT